MVKLGLHVVLVCFDCCSSPLFNQCPHCMMRSEMVAPLKPCVFAQIGGQDLVSISSSISGTSDQKFWFKTGPFDYILGVLLIYKQYLLLRTQIKPGLTQSCAASSYTAQATIQIILILISWSFEYFSIILVFHRLQLCIKISILFCLYKLINLKHFQLEREMKQP